MKITHVPETYVTTTILEMLEAQAPILADEVIENDVRDQAAVDLMLTFARVYHLARVSPYQAVMELEKAYPSAHMSVEEQIIFSYQVSEGEL